MAVTKRRASEIMDFSLSLPNLRELAITVSQKYLQLPALTSGYQDNVSITQFLPPKSVKEIIEEYDLAKLLQIPNLKRLTMICEFGNGGPDIASSDLLRALRDWMRREFCDSEGVTTVKDKALDPNKDVVVSGFTFCIERV